MADNVFDQFHEQEPASTTASNVFDRFHEPEQARSSTSTPSASAPSPNVFDQFHEPPTTAKPDFSDVRSDATFTPQTPSPGLGELATRGFVQGGAALMRTVQNVADSFTGQGLTKQIAESQMPPEVRAAFHEQAYPLDTLAKSADEYAAPAPGEAAPGLAGRVVQGASKLVPEVAGVIGTGGESAVPGALTTAARAVPYVGRVLGGIAEGLPTAAKFTAEQASNLPADMTPGQKLAETAKDFGINAAMAGLPAALGTSPLVRVPTGAVIGAGQSAALSALEGQPQDAAQNIIGALQGGAFGFVPHAPAETKPRNAEQQPVAQASTGNVFDQFHESEGLMNPFDAAEPRTREQEPAKSDYRPNLVADESGVLRAVPTQPEKPQVVSEHPQLTAVPDWVQPAQTPNLPDPNAGPISRAAAQVTPAHQAEQGVSPLPTRFPEAETGSLAHAANAIDNTPQDAVNPFDVIDPPTTARTERVTSTVPDALRAIAAGEHPEQVLADASSDTVRTVAAAMGKRYSSAAPIDAIVQRLGELPDADRVRIASTAAMSLYDEALSEPARQGAGGASDNLDPTKPNMPKGNEQTRLQAAVAEDAQHQPYEDEQTARANGFPNAEAMYRAEIPEYGAEAVYARTPRATFADALDRFRANAPQATPEQSARNARTESAIERDMALENRRKAQDSAELAGLQEHEHQEPTYVAAARRAWREQGTESPFFQHWFGDSKAVDAQGKPRMVFHGTSEDFNAFRDDKLGGNTGHMTAPLGHFLTESRPEAQRYAEKAANGVPADERVIESYLSIKHPAVMTKDQFLAIDSQEAARSLRQWLERHGHDGIRLDLGNGKMQWIAFDSGQIKDVNNRGTFERSNPDIRYARRAADESGTPLTKEEVSTHASRIVGAIASEGVDADRRIPISVVDSFEKLPDAPRKMAEGEGVRNGDIKALHVDGRSYLLADQMHTPADVQEAIFHEHYTHGGLRAKYGAELGPKLDELLHGVGGVDGVRRLAERQRIDLSGYEKAIAENLKISEPIRQRVLMEELLAHMSKLTGTLKRTVQEWAGAVRDWLRRNGFAELAQYGETDLAHVLRQARQAANEKTGATSTSRPFYQRAPDARPVGGRDALSMDELREAQNAAKRGAFAKMFQFAKDGEQTVVSYNGKELARVDGTPNRKSLTAAIDARLRAQQPEAEPTARSTATSAAPTSPEQPPRRPGEPPVVYARRISDEHAEDLRAATALKGQQKTIGRHAIREMLAKRSRAMDVADAAFNEYRKLFDRTDPAKNLEHVDEWETGKRVTDPDMRAFLAQMKVGFNERVQRLRELDPRALQHLITHYMPHIYSDPAKAARLLKANVDAQAARHSIAGGKEFLEPRSWPTLKWAMHSGLEPITSNPVDWIMLRYASMDKLIGSLELKHELDNRGWLSKVKSEEEPPLGYKRVADPAFNGYALPDPIARDITNYLDPGFSKYAAWRTLRGAQNFLVAANLGFSGFHAVFTSSDNVIMHTDVALRRAAIGDSRGAAATLVKALTSVVTSPFEGHKLNQQWRGIREADANTAAIIDALERGGARWKMSSTEYQNAIPKLARMFRQMQGAGIAAQLKGKTPAQIAVGAIKVPLTALQAAAETGSYLIHHMLVPAQKMAARVLLYKYELDRRAQDLGQQRGDYSAILNAMHPDVVRQLAAQVNDVVDYRLGQMAYDNRFWPRVVQDVAQAAVMAPGWQYGMLQTVLGAGKAVKDLVSPTKLVATLDRAGTITNAHMGRVSSNLSYFLTLALTLGGSMAALQYMLTGQGPTQLKDLFFPKTGRKNDDDSDERLQLPNYWVDHYKLATEPGQTAENKIHPLWKMLWEVGHNKDYFGTRIRDPNAPALEQAQEVGKYLASKFVPITFGNMQKGAQHNETTTQQAGHFFGINSAPSRVARSDFQNFIAQGGTRGWGNYMKTPEDAQRRQQMHAASAAIRRGEQPDFGNLMPADQIKARKDAKLPVPAMLFKSLSDTDKLHAYEMATPEERQEYGLHGVISRMNIEKSAPFKRLASEEQAKVRQRLQAIRSGAQ